MNEKNINNSNSWIKEIPSYWNETKLKYIISHIAGAWGDDPTDNSGTICMRIADFDYNKGIFKDIDIGFLTRRAYKDNQIKKLQLKINDILIEKSGGGEKTPVGRTVIFDKDYFALYANFMERFRVINPSVDAQFLNYWLRAWYSCGYSPYYINQTTGIQNLDIIQMINSEHVYFPNFNEQLNIVKFLDNKCSSIDEAISRNNQMIEKLEEYKKSVISKVVTKGLNENIEMKDSEIEWIGDVPESWDIIPLKVLFKENKKRNSELINNNLLSLSYGRIVQKDIYSNYGLLPDNFSKYTILNEGDIVLRLTDLQNDHKSLRTGLVTQSGIITSAYVTLTPKKKLCSRYFHYLLHSYDIQKVFYTMGEGIRQNLNYDELSRNIRLVKPPLKEQQSIANYLDSKCLVIDESIKQSKKIIQKFEEYKKSIIYNAVTGKIDCRKEIVHE